MVRQVTAAVIVEDGRLFLARRAPGEKLAGLWELPGGKVEPGESAAECLVRELDEELAMAVEVGREVARTRFEYDHGAFEMIALAVRRRTGFEPRVHDACAWVTREEIGEFDMAPADVELVAQLVSAGEWG